jgi:hypothetical protein
MNSGKLDAAEQDAKVGNNTMSVLNGAENDNENPPKLIMRVGHALIAVEKGKLDPLKFKCFTKFVVNAVLSLDQQNEREAGWCEEDHWQRTPELTLHRWRRLQEDLAYA